LSVSQNRKKNVKKKKRKAPRGLNCEWALFPPLFCLTNEQPFHSYLSTISRVNPQDGKEHLDGQEEKVADVSYSVRGREKLFLIDNVLVRLYPCPPHLSAVVSSLESSLHPVLLRLSTPLLSQQFSPLVMRFLSPRLLLLVLICQKHPFF
jgi:hypothetical protein